MPTPSRHPVGLVLTPYETYVVERTRAAVAQRRNDLPATMKALEAALATGQASKEDETRLAEAIVGLAHAVKDAQTVLRWAGRYIELDGPSDAVRLLRIQAQLDTGDVEGAKTALQARVEAADQAGRTLPEVQLRLLVGAQQRTKDPGLARTLERLAVAYPRPEYWLAVISPVTRDPALDDRALLNLFRLLRATNNLNRADLRDEMAQRAQRLGQPGEALAIVEEGFASGQFGTGAGAADQQKLREQLGRLAAVDRNDRPAAEAAARKAPDGNGLVDLGWALVASQPAGAAASALEPGLALIEQGIAKGGLRRPAEARLQLAIAQLAAGRKDAARQTLAAASATDGLAAVVRLWALWAQAPAMLPPRN